MDYLLCSGLLRKYNDDKVRQIVAGYAQAHDHLKQCHETIDQLDQKIAILEAENKLLKKHPVDCGDPECSPYGCICYTR